MKSGKLGTLLLLEAHLLWLFALSVQGHDNVIDLLAPLNTSQHINGVSKLQSALGHTVYGICPKAPSLILPQEYSHFLHSNLQGGMGVHLVGHQALGSSATLFSLSSASSPILQIISSTLNNTLHVDYQAGGGGRAQSHASFHFPGKNPFSRDEWVQFAVSLETHRLAFFVDCQEAVVLQLKSEERIKLQIPQDVVVTLASTPGKKDSKFSGYLKTAEISMKAYMMRPWRCDNVTDDLQDSSPSKPPTSRRAKNKKKHYPQDIQSDQLQRAVVLGRPGSPQGAKCGFQEQKDDQLKKLEKRLEELALMLDMVKTQNSNLQSRVQYLEGCECVRQRCVWEGREVEDGQRWQTDLNTVCTCTSGKVTCQSNIKASLQIPVPLSDPCLSNPCQNGGVCFILTSDPGGFHCSCPPNTKGPLCHRQMRQACLVPKPESNCEDMRLFQRHWAFNPTSGLCEDFLYCGGNSSNNFPSFNVCRNQCMMGACCLRKPRLDLSAGHQHWTQHRDYISSVNRTHLGYNQPQNLEDKALYNYTDFNLAELKDLEENYANLNCHSDPHFTFTCDYITLTQCRSLKDQAGEEQVLSFSPGVKCSDVECSGRCGCFFRHKLWRYGQKFRQGSEECICTRSGRVDCLCRHLTQRKEIRDLTLRERRLYHRAIRKLYARQALWKGFALLRAEFSPLASDRAFFLPWHRYFLRLVEHELQSLSCKLALPYFEWTVDSGSMKFSAAWEAGLFGGDGEPDSGCVPHHPFQDLTSRLHWSPCLRRSFNSSVWLPDAVTLQRTVNQADFKVFSQSLQTFSGLFRLWVGGHMASPLASYDPLYLSHMAFMDKLWTEWQEKHQQGSKTQTSTDEHAQNNIPFPAKQQHVKMEPFDVTPNDVMSSQQQMCVVYVPITIGAPCNVTSLHGQSSNRESEKRGFDKGNFVFGGFDSSGFNRRGYDRDGFDRSGWDRWGYGKDGFNRDFIDRDGYNIFGFNRYGFNRSNVTWFGMRKDGVFEDENDKKKEKREESDDSTQRDRIMSDLFSDKGYNIYGFDPFGYDRGGLDVYGFQTDGYDKDRCNWFFSGPHYLRFYFHTQQQLMSSSARALSRITRTCPPITCLPQHWATQDWMTLDSDQSSAPNGRVQQEWMGQTKPESDDMFVAATQNKMIAWLPVTPDDRFCFKLHWFSGCPLGSAPIACPDLCHQARCHGSPEAVCLMRNCGSCFTEWRDPVTGNHVICHGW